MTEYKFICDFYYSQYNKTNNRSGTIYRHYNDTKEIEYIHGCNENEILSQEFNKILLETFNIVKTDIFDTDKITVSGNNDYLSNYDYNTNNDDYFKNLSLTHLCDSNNYLQLIDIDHETSNINIGVIFGFIKTSKFDINNVKIRYNQNNDDDDDDCLVNSDIDFTTYKTYIQDCIHTENIEQCANQKLPNYKNFEKKKCKRGGAIDIVKTEQNYITHEVIMHYFKSSDIKQPVFIEYDYEEQNFFVVDGNHRVAFHIINNYEYIPVMIILKKFDKIDLNPKNSIECSKEPIKSCPNKKKRNKRK